MDNKLSQEKLNKLLDLHLLFLRNQGGKKLVLLGEDLSGADLSGADLSEAILSRADLFRANLSEANLSGANLFRANLSRANLSGANLRLVFCAKTFFHEAILIGVNFSGVDCYNAEFLEAEIDESTIFADHSD